MHACSAAAVAPNAELPRLLRSPRSGGQRDIEGSCICLRQWRPAGARRWRALTAASASQGLKTPERLLELSKRLSKVADDFESLRTRLAPPGSAAADSSPAKSLPLPPSSGSDESTLSRFTSILSRLETVTDQVSELRDSSSPAG